MKLVLRVFLIATLILFVACKASNNHTPTAHLVNLMVTDEVIDMDGGSPLQSSPFVSENSLYGVQVYARQNSKGTSYSPYAYGIFDDPSIIELKMYEESLYKFEITKIVDGKSILPIISGNNYRAPLLVSGTCGSTLNNIMSESSSCILTGLAAGQTYLYKEGNSGATQLYAHPNVDRYYGELIDFSPSAENLSPTIELKRVSFGIDFTVNNLNQGKVTIILSGSPTITIESGKSNTASHIFTLEGQMGNPSAWTKDNYIENIMVDVKWVKDGGIVVPIANKSLPFNRKHRYNMNINLSQPSYDNTAIITTEGGELIQGEDIVFEN